MNSGVISVIAIGIITISMNASHNLSCQGSPTITLTGCGPEELGIQSRFRDLCLAWLKQQAYENFKSEPMGGRFMNGDGAQPEMMLMPGSEPHFTSKSSTVGN